MRRISLLLAAAVLLLFAIVGFTYYARKMRQRGMPTTAVPTIKNGYDAIASSGWSWDKDDPQTNQPVVRVRARSFQAAHNPSTYQLKDVSLKLYAKTGSSYTYVRSGEATLDESSGILKSIGPVAIVMKVPKDDDAENKDKIAKLIKVSTSGVTYETKTGKADTDAPAIFNFAQGSGHATGVNYDPNTGDLHLKSAVTVDLIGNGAASSAMHVEAGDLVYKEREGKIYLSPWSKLKRQSTEVNAQTSVITLKDDLLQQIDSENAIGSDTRSTGRTDFAAVHLTSTFNDAGVMTDMVGSGSARIVSTRETSKTTITADKADMRFIESARPGVDAGADNLLQQVFADGHAALQSDPIARTGVAAAETRLLHSEHIQVQMAPDGKEVQQIVCPTQAELEFRPNTAGQSHRLLKASEMRIVYGEGSYLDAVYATNATTKTDRPPVPGKAAGGPAVTSSDRLIAHFTPGSNQLAAIEQTGNFRYQEGTRKAKASQALLEQAVNRITLNGSAQVSDETGVSIGDKIVMSQSSGDMDAEGHVYSSRAPEKNQKPGTSMLDNTKAMQAKADMMQTREDNTSILYAGHAVIWQGANRISADRIQIDRDGETIHATGNVDSELVDNKAENGVQQRPVFTVVRAPELAYNDNDRIADYTGGVKLTRASMVITSKELKAFLTPSNEGQDSSLDHAFADGGVKVVQTMVANRSREGQAEHGEFYTKENKVILNGGTPEIVDSHKGRTRGRQLTYFSDDDRLLVDGGSAKDLAYTQMRKK